MLDKTDETRRNYGKVVDHHQRNDGRRRTGTDGSGRDQDARNDMSYDDVRSRGKDTKLAKEQVRKDQTEQGRGTEEKELMNGRGQKGGKKGSKGSTSDRYADKDNGSNGNKGKGKGTDEENDRGS